MRPGPLVRLGLGAARHRLTGKRAPLTAFVAVTNRCDSCCGYCTMPYRADREPTSDELLAVVDSLADNGCQALVLTGGEPLIRPDLPQLIARCRAHGMWVRLETNGHAWLERADAIGHVDQIVLSLDGDRAAHDAAREPGSYDKVHAALLDATQRGLQVATRTVLHKHAIGALDHVLDLAARHGHLAVFQLLECDSPEALRPTRAEVRRALRVLLEARREARPVALTEKTLRTYLAWDDYQHVRSDRPHDDQHCTAGLTHCYVDTAGRVYSCSELTDISPALSIHDVGFEAAFAAIDKGTCQSCVARGLAEHNQLMNLNVPTLLGFVGTWSLEK